MAPRWLWLCWTSTTSSFWPGGFSTCLSPFPGTWPGRPATTHGTQVTNLLQTASEVLTMFLILLRITTFCSFPYRTLCGVSEEKHLKQPIDQPERHLSCHRVLGVSSSVCPTSSQWFITVPKNDNDASSRCFFLLPAGEEHSGFPQASTTWALWTGTWPCACLLLGSCATFASGRGRNLQERWVMRTSVSVQMKTPADLFFIYQKHLGWHLIFI